ncbi:hypothetical protein ACFYWU_42400 [Streptomyces chrestomyceticus]|uniref:hypothetical protein n=1 Tax=Streptomyces chrestomyceticus TaxID=68185 RepID=UPI00369A7A09
MKMLHPYLLIERPGIVAAAPCTPRRRHRELFVVDHLEADGTWAHGVLDDVPITRTVKMLKPPRGNDDVVAAMERVLAVLSLGIPDAPWEEICGLLSIRPRPIRRHDVRRLAAR